MSYDPTQWAPQPPDQQPPVTPPAYPAPQPPAQPPQPQYPPAVPPTAYAQPGQVPAAPAYGQPSSPNYPAYGAPGVPGQPSSPNYPAYGAPGVPGQPSSPNYPAYGAPGVPGQPSSPNYPAYGAPAAPEQPTYGQPSGPNYPAYGAPTDQQPPAWGAAMPPGYVPPAPAAKKKSPALLITIIVLVIVVLGGAGGGYYAYQVTRPKPVISISSKYMDAGTPIGATSTDGLVVTGTDFSANEAITFLNDGAPGFPGTVTSDSKGAVTATLTVGPGWATGFHTITAKDKDGYTTKLGVKVEIVTAGTKGTPGPNGAPTDSANMIVTAAITIGGNNATSMLTVKNGSVCAADDDGQSHSSNHTTSGGVTYVETIAKTCTGTYQGGKLTYTETYTVFKAVYSNGLVCGIPRPFVAQHLEGTFTSSTAVSGSYSSDATSFDCNLGAGSLPINAETGTWTGVAVVS